MLINRFVVVILTVIGGHLWHVQADEGSPVQDAASKPIRQEQPPTAGSDLHPAANMPPSLLPSELLLMVGRSQAVCATGTQQNGAQQRLSVTSTPVAEWIAALRLGPHSELVDAGETALPILIAAIQDPQASRWLLLSLNFDKTDGEWLIPVYIAGLRNPDTFTSRDCLEKLSKLGSLVRPFVPSVLDVLREPSNKWNDFPELPILAFLDEIGASNGEYLEFAHLIFDRTLPTTLGEMPLPGDSFDRDEALEAIVSVGPQSLPILFEIIRENKGLPDEGERYLFHSRIWRLDADFQPGILAELQSVEAERRRAAAWLMFMQSDPYFDGLLTQSVLSELVPYINDEDIVVRRYILQIFEREVSESVEAVPALVAQLDDTDPANGRHAGQALGKIGTPALAEIRKAAASDNLSLRLNGTVALASVDVLSASEVALLVTLARDSNLEIRIFALWGLRRATEVTPELVEALSAALKDPTTCRTAVATIAQIGPPALETLPMLVEALEKSPPEYRVSLAGAIWKIDPGSTLVIPTMVAILKANQDTSASIDAARALGEMKSAATPAVSALVSEIASNRPENLRLQAVIALAKIGPSAEEAVPALTKIAAEEVGWLQESAATALGRIVPASSSAVHLDEISEHRVVLTNAHQVKRRVPSRGTPKG